MIKAIQNIILTLFLLFNFYISNHKFNLPFLYLYGIETLPFLHAMITSSFSNYLLITNPDFIFHIEKYDQTSLSDIFFIVPIYTCSYGIFDFYYGFKLKNISFMIHGSMLLVGSMFLYSTNNLHLFYPPLIMETSSIFLNIMILPNANIIYKYLFAFTFFFYRYFIFTFISYFFIQNTILKTNQENVYINMVGISLIAVSNVLNYFWGYKIIKKMIKYSRRSN